MKQGLFFAGLLALGVSCRGGVAGAIDTTRAHDGGPSDSGISAELCTDTWEEYGQVTFATTCASCHEHDHSPFITRSTVLAQAALIVDRVSSGKMPKGTELSEAERERLLRYVSCGAPSRHTDAGYAFENVSPYTAVAKVKNILVGLPPSADEVAAVEADAQALSGLIDRWMQLPEYEEKMKVFFSLAFQQTQVTVADFIDVLPGGLVGAAAPMFVENVRQSFARTVIALAAEGKPFQEAFTTRRFMLTPALMEFMAYLDVRRADNTGKVIDDWAKANPNKKMVVSFDAGQIPLEETLNPDGGNYLHFYNPDLPKLPSPIPECFVDPVVIAPVIAQHIHDILYGQIDGYRVPNPDGGSVPTSCPPRGSTLAGMQLTTADFNDWKMVTIRPPAPGEATTHFFDLPKLRTATQLVLNTPRVGFFTTLGFQANWPTNQSNQFRVTINQAMIVATGMQFDGLDSTLSPQTPGIDAKHAENSACYSCHRLLDPTRAIFSATYSYFYNPATDVALMSEKGLFNFRGVTKPVVSLDDFASTLSTHPAVPLAWGQKLCQYVNSAPCDPNDPQFKRAVENFGRTGAWSTLVRELLMSPSITNLSDSTTYASQGEILAVSRRDHFCAALDARLKLNDACGRNFVLGSRSGIGNIPAIASGLPSDGYGRGATTPILPNAPTLFFRAGAENICAILATQLVDAAVQPTQPNALRWTNTQADAAIRDFTTLLIGIPQSDPRFAAAHGLLAKHYADAQKTSSKAEALRSTFVTACLSPTLIGVGL